MTAELDVNGCGGEVSVPTKDLPNANADGGLVFVNGCGSGSGNKDTDQNDAVFSSDPVETDLNCGSTVSVVQSDLNSYKPAVESRESVVESEILRVEENGEEKIEISHVQEKQESPVLVHDGTDDEVDRENEVSDSTTGQVISENQGVGENPEVDTELVAVESANDYQPQESTHVVCDLVYGDQCTPQQIEDIAESMPSLVNVAADLPVEPACENENEDEDDAPNKTGDIPEANSVEEVKVDLEEAAPYLHEGDVVLESQVVGTPAVNGGPGLDSAMDTGHTQNVTPEMVISINLDATTPVLGNSSEIATENLPFPVVSENIYIENGQSFHTAPVAVCITPQSTEPDACSDSHLFDNAKLDIQVENLPLDDTVSSGCLNNYAGLETDTDFDSNASKPKVSEGVAENVANGLNYGAGTGFNSNVLVEKISMEPKVPEWVENCPDLRSETEANVLIHSNASEENVPEGVAETEVESDKVSTFPSEDSCMETKVLEGDSNVELKVPAGIVEGVDCQSVAVDNASLEDHTGDDPVERENISATCCSGIDVNAETEIKNTQQSVVGSRDVPLDVNTETEIENSQQSAASSRDVSRERAVSESRAQNGSACSPILVEDGEIQFTDEDSDDKKSHQLEAIDGIHKDEAPTSTPESSMAASDAQNVAAEAVAASEAHNVGTRPFYCLIKVPRFEDGNLKEQINSFQLKVDEKTRSRDAIRDTIHTRRAIFKEHGENLEAAISEEKMAREMLKSKRQEIDSLQSVINKVKNAISVEDIDGKIYQMKHMIEHETLPLKEEKQLIREIEQLKQHREQFSSSIGKQEEIQLAFDQKDQIEERLKVLRKEADSLRENVSKAEAATQAARKKHKDENEKLRELQTQFKAADETRQEAYKNLQSLKKQAYDKNKYFWNYKDDVKAANDLLSKGDKEALQNLCDNQVERVLEMWNCNNDFRKEYVRCNINSTLRRLKTLDGRSLGPNEKPPLIRSVVINRVARDSSASQISTVKEEKPEQVVPLKTENENKSMVKVGEQKDVAVIAQRLAKYAYLENGSATVSGSVAVKAQRPAKYNYLENGSATVSGSVAVKAQRPAKYDYLENGSASATVSGNVAVKAQRPAKYDYLENDSATVSDNVAVKAHRPAKYAYLENGSVSGRNEIEETREEEPKQRKKEEELARKAEELRKKEEAAKLREQRMLEEKVKAKEALERKKRIADKAQARAALRAQKEAEEKEKEREKRARKKEKKRVASTEDTSVTNEEESDPSTETATKTPTLGDVKEKSTTVRKKGKKPSQLTKQSKWKSVPLGVRNRGKRSMPSWMWVIIAGLVVFGLFVLGNSNLSFKSGQQWFGF